MQFNLLFVSKSDDLLPNISGELLWVVGLFKFADVLPVDFQRSISL